MPFLNKEIKEREAEFVRAYNARAQNGHASPVHCAMCIHPMNQKFLSPDFMSSSIKKEGSVHITPPSIFPCVAMLKRCRRYFHVSI